MRKNCRQGNDGWGMREIKESDEERKAAHRETRDYPFLSLDGYPSASHRTGDHDTDREETDMVSD